MVPEQINSGTLAEVQGVQTRRPVEGTCGSALLANCPDSAPTCPHISLSGPDSPKHNGLESRFAWLPAFAAAMPLP
jgi:hypothetical protein